MHVVIRRVKITFGLSEPESGVHVSEVSAATSRRWWTAAISFFLNLREFLEIKQIKQIKNSNTAITKTIENKKICPAQFCQSILKNEN